MIYNKLENEKIDNYWEMLQAIKKLIKETLQESKPKGSFLDLMTTHPYLTTSVIILVAGIYYFYYNNYFSYVFESLAHLAKENLNIYYIHKQIIENQNAITHV
jgi:hypothetical protein